MRRRLSGWLRLGAALAAAAGLVGCDPVERGDRAWAEGDASAAAAAWGSAALDTAHQQRLARALYQIGEAERARALIAALPFESMGAEGHLVAGLLALDSGQLDVALAAFEAGLSIEPLPALAVNACTARLTLGADPLERCQQAVELAPTDPFAYLGLAQAAAGAGLVDVAREALYSATRHVGDPIQPGAAAWIAEGWAGTGDFAQACEWSMEGATDPLSAGRWCAAAGRRETARGLLEPLAPDSPPAAALLLTLALDDLSGAVSGYARETGLARCRRWARVLLASVEPLSAAERTDLGRLARSEGRDQEAERWWGEAIDLAPGEPAPRINLSRQLAGRGLVDSARQVLDPSAATPLDALALGLELARLERRSGAPAEATAVARSVLDGCVELGAGDCEAGAAYLLARLLAAEDPERALALLDRAVAAGGAGVGPSAAREPDFELLRDQVHFHELTGLGER